MWRCWNSVATATVPGLSRTIGGFIQAEVGHRVLNEQVLGDKADHFRWARRPEVVAGIVATWSGRQMELLLSSG